MADHIHNKYKAMQIRSVHSWPTSDQKLTNIKVFDSKRLLFQKHICIPFPTPRQKEPGAQHVTSLPDYFSLSEGRRAPESLPLAYVCDIAHGEERQAAQRALELPAAGRVPEAQGALAQRQAVPGAHGRVRQGPPDAAHGLATAGHKQGLLTPPHSPLLNSNWLRHKHGSVSKNNQTGQGHLANWCELRTNEVLTFCTRRLLDSNLHQCSKKNSSQFLLISIN